MGLEIESIYLWAGSWYLYCVSRKGLMPDYKIINSAGQIVQLMKHYQLSYRIKIIPKIDYKWFLRLGYTQTR